MTNKNVEKKKNEEKTPKMNHTQLQKNEISMGK